MTTPVQQQDRKNETARNNSAQQALSTQNATKDLLFTDLENRAKTIAQLDALGQRGTKRYADLTRDQKNAEEILKAKGATQEQIRKREDAAYKDTFSKWGDAAQTAREVYAAQHSGVFGKDDVERIQKALTGLNKDQIELAAQAWDKLRSAGEFRRVVSDFKTEVRSTGTLRSTTREMERLLAGTQAEKRTLSIGQSIILPDATAIADIQKNIVDAHAGLVKSVWTGGRSEVQKLQKEFHEIQERNKDKKTLGELSVADRERAKFLASQIADAAQNAVGNSKGVGETINSTVSTGLAVAAGIVVGIGTAPVSIPVVIGGALVLTATKFATRKSLQVDGSIVGDAFSSVVDVGMAGVGKAALPVLQKLGLAATAETAFKELSKRIAVHVGGGAATGSVFGAVDGSVREGFAVASDGKQDSVGEALSRVAHGAATGGAMGALFGGLFGSLGIGKTRPVGSGPVETGPVPGTAESVEFKVVEPSSGASTAPAGAPTATSQPAAGQSGAAGSSGASVNSGAPAASNPASANPTAANPAATAPSAAPVDPNARFAPPSAEGGNAGATPEGKPKINIKFNRPAESAPSVSGDVVLTPDASPYPGEKPIKVTFRRGDGSVIEPGKAGIRENVQLHEGTVSSLQRRYKQFMNGNVENVIHTANTADEAARVATIRNGLANELETAAAHAKGQDIGGIAETITKIREGEPLRQNDYIRLRRFGIQTGDMNPVTPETTISTLRSAMSELQETAATVRNNALQPEMEAAMLSKRGELQSRVQKLQKELAQELRSEGALTPEAARAVEVLESGRPIPAKQLEELGASRQPKAAAVEADPAPVKSAEPTTPAKEGTTVAAPVAPKLAGDPNQSLGENIKGYVSHLRRVAKGEESLDLSFRAEIEERLIAAVRARHPELPADLQAAVNSLAHSPNSQEYGAAFKALSAATRNEPRVAAARLSGEAAQVEAAAAAIATQQPVAPAVSVTQAAQAAEAAVTQSREEARALAARIAGELRSAEGASLSPELQAMISQLESSRDLSAGQIDEIIKKLKSAQARASETAPKGGASPESAKVSETPAAKPSEVVEMPLSSAQLLADARASEERIALLSNAKAALGNWSSLRGQPSDKVQAVLQRINTFTRRLSDDNIVSDVDLDSAVGSFVRSPSDPESRKVLSSALTKELEAEKSNLQAVLEEAQELGIEIPTRGGKASTAKSRPATAERSSSSDASPKTDAPTSEPVVSAERVSPREVAPTTPGARAAATIDALSALTGSIKPGTPRSTNTPISNEAKDAIRALLGNKEQPGLSRETTAELQYLLRNTEATQARIDRIRGLVQNDVAGKPVTAATDASEALRAKQSAAPKEASRASASSASIEERMESTVQALSELTSSIKPGTPRSANTPITNEAKSAIRSLLRNADENGLSRDTAIELRYLLRNSEATQARIDRIRGLVKNDIAKRAQAVESVPEVVRPIDVEPVATSTLATPVQSLTADIERVAEGVNLQTQLLGGRNPLSGKQASEVKKLQTAAMRILDDGSLSATLDEQSIAALRKLTTISAEHGNSGYLSSEVAESLSEVASVLRGARSPAKVGNVLGNGIVPNEAVAEIVTSQAESAARVGVGPRRGPASGASFSKRGVRLNLSPKGDPSGNGPIPPKEPITGNTPTEPSASGDNWFDDFEFPEEPAVPSAVESAAPSTPPAPEPVVAEQTHVAAPEVVTAPVVDPAAAPQGDPVVEVVQAAPVADPANVAPSASTTQLTPEQEAVERLINDTNWATPTPVAPASTVGTHAEMPRWTEAELSSEAFVGKLSTHLLARGGRFNGSADLAEMAEGVRGAFFDSPGNPANLDTQLTRLIGELGAGNPLATELGQLQAELRQQLTTGDFNGAVVTSRQLHNTLNQNRYQPAPATTLSSAASAPSATPTGSSVPVGATQTGPTPAGPGAATGTTTGPGTTPATGPGAAAGATPIVTPRGRTSANPIFSSRRSAPYRVSGTISDTSLWDDANAVLDAIEQLDVVNDELRAAISATKLPGNAGNLAVHNAANDAILVHTQVTGELERAVNNLTRTFSEFSILLAPQDPSIVAMKPLMAQLQNAFKGLAKKAGTELKAQEITGAARSADVVMLHVEQQAAQPIQFRRWASTTSAPASNPDTITRLTFWNDVASFESTLTDLRTQANTLLGNPTDIGALAAFGQAQRELNQRVLQLRHTLGDLRSSTSSADPVTRTMSRMVDDITVASKVFILGTPDDVAKLENLARAYDSAGRIRGVVDTHSGTPLTPPDPGSPAVSFNDGIAGRAKKAINRVRAARTRAYTNLRNGQTRQEIFEGGADLTDIGATNNEVQQVLSAVRKTINERELYDNPQGLLRKQLDDALKALNDKDSSADLIIHSQNVQTRVGTRRPEGLDRGDAASLAIQNILDRQFGHLPSSRATDLADIAHDRIRAYWELSPRARQRTAANLMVSDGRGVELFTAARRNNSADQKRWREGDDAVARDAYNHVRRAIKTRWGTDPALVIGAVGTTAYAINKSLDSGSGSDAASTDTPTPPTPGGPVPVAADSTEDSTPTATDQASSPLNVESYKEVAGIVKYKPQLGNTSPLLAGIVMGRYLNSMSIDDQGNLVLQGQFTPIPTGAENDPTVRENQERSARYLKIAAEQAMSEASVIGQPADQSLKEEAPTNMATVRRAIELFLEQEKRYWTALPENQSVAAEQRFYSQEEQNRIVNRIVSDYRQMLQALGQTPVEAPSRDDAAAATAGTTPVTEEGKPIAATNATLREQGAAMFQSISYPSRTLLS